MSDINNVLFSGEVIADAQSRMTQNGKEFINFTVKATEDFGKGEPKETFISCSAWGDTANVARTLAKGDTVVVAGRLTSRPSATGQYHNLSVGATRIVIAAAEGVF